MIEIVRTKDVKGKEQTNEVAVGKVDTDQNILLDICSFNCASEFIIGQVEQDKKFKLN